MSASEKSARAGAPAGQTEGGLQQDSEGLAELLAHQGIALCLIDASSRVVWSNRSHVALHGWGAQVGEPCHESIVGRHRPCPGCLTREVLQTGQPSRLERRVSSSGSERAVCLTASPVFDASRRVTHVLLVTTDVVDALTSPERDESEKLASLGVMAAGVVHELNNILGGMCGHAELAQIHPERDETIRRALDVVRSGGRRGQAILKQLSDYSRQQTGERASFNLVDVVEQILLMASRNLALDAVHIERRYDRRPTVFANPWRVRQFLLNLLLEVMRSVKRGSSLTVTVRDADVSTEDRRVSLSVRYVSAERETKTDASSRCWFDRTTADASGCWNPYEAASRAVVEMGGKIQMNENEGTREIRATFPVGAAVEPAPASSTTLSVRKKRVLVVDDEEVICDLLSAVLGERGYEVTTAGTGRRAIELLEETPFDAVLLDYMMPGQLSGADAMKEIRTLRPECRIVMMTGRPPDEQLVAELRKADAHVLKPFRCQELMDCLHHVAV